MPFFFGLNRDDTARAIQRCPPDFREAMFRPGLVHSAPKFVQTLLLPAPQAIPATTARKKLPNPAKTLRYTAPASEAPKPPDDFVDKLIASWFQKSVMGSVIPQQMDCRPVAAVSAVLFVLQFLMFKRARQALFQQGRVVSLTATGMTAIASLALAFWQQEQGKRRR